MVSLELTRLKDASQGVLLMNMQILLFEFAFKIVQSDLITTKLVIENVFSNVQQLQFYPTS